MDVVWVFKARSLHPLPASGRSTWCKLISVSFDREIRGPSSSSSSSILTSSRWGESTLVLSCGRRPLLVSKQCRLFVKIPVATMVFFSYWHLFFSLSPPSQLDTHTIVIQAVRHRDTKEPDKDLSSILFLFDGPYLLILALAQSYS